MKIGTTKLTANDLREIVSEIHNNMNIIDLLLDQGYLNDDLTIKDTVSTKDISDYLGDLGYFRLEDYTDFNGFVKETKNLAKTFSNL